MPSMTLCVELKYEKSVYVGKQFETCIFYIIWYTKCLPAMCVCERTVFLIIM